MDWLEKLLGVGTAVGGGLLTKDAIDRLGTLGAAAKQEAFDLAEEIQPMTQFKPFTVTSATGGQFDVGAGGDVSMTLSEQEKAIQNMMMRGAQQTFGATPFGQQMGRDAAQQAFGLGSQFMEQSGMSTADRESAIYERIRAAQSPEEERQRLALEERLQQQGRGGVSTSMFGGTPEQLAMSKAQAEAQNTAMLQAMQQAQREQAQQAQLGQTYAGLGGQLRQQDLAQLTGQQQLGMGMLGGAYMPQAQLLNVQQASQLYPQLQQQAQLFGAGQYGETMMTGIEAQLLAEQAQANLIGGLGSGLLSGLFTPVAQQGGGATNVLTSLLQGITSDVRLKENIEKVGTVKGINLYVWDWNEEGKKIAGNQRAFGVLAQEVAKDRPSAVVEGLDGYLRVNYSELPEVADLVLFGEE